MTAKLVSPTGRLAGLQASRCGVVREWVGDAQPLLLQNLMIAKQAIRSGKLVGHRPRNIGVVPLKIWPVMHSTAWKGLTAGSLPGVKQNEHGAVTSVVKDALL